MAYPAVYHYLAFITLVVLGFFSPGRFFLPYTPFLIIFVHKRDSTQPLAWQSMIFVAPYVITLLFLYLVDRTFGRSLLTILNNLLNPVIQTMKESVQVLLDTMSLTLKQMVQVFREIFGQLFAALVDSLKQTTSCLTKVVEKFLTGRSTTQ